MLLILLLQWAFLLLFCGLLQNHLQPPCRAHGFICAESLIYIFEIEILRELLRLVDVALLSLLRAMLNFLHPVKVLRVNIYILQVLIQCIEILRNVNLSMLVELYLAECSWFLLLLRFYRVSISASFLLILLLL
jgi:hypothetical protein